LEPKIFNSWVENGSQSNSRCVRWLGARGNDGVEANVFGISHYYQYFPFRLLIFNSFLTPILIHSFIQ
jgi:hypothetical protein